MAETTGSNVSSAPIPTASDQLARGADWLRLLPMYVVIFFAFVVLAAHSNVARHGIDDGSVNLLGKPKEGHPLCPPLVGPRR
jgi:hypothetical protein